MVGWMRWGTGGSPSTHPTQTVGVCGWVATPEPSCVSEADVWPFTLDLHARKLYSYDGKAHVMVMQAAESSARQTNGKELQACIRALKVMPAHVLRYLCVGSQLDTHGVTPRPLE